MAEACRTVAVYGGGAVGSFFGPAGTIAGGMIGGVIADLTTSLVTNKDHGYIKNGSEVIDHISRREIPLRASGEMLLSGTVDGFGGYVGGRICAGKDLKATSALIYSTARSITS